MFLFTTISSFERDIFTGVFFLFDLLSISAVLPHLSYYLYTPVANHTVYLAVQLTFSQLYKYIFKVARASADSFIAPGPLWNSMLCYTMDAVVSSALRSRLVFPSLLGIDLYLLFFNSASLVAIIAQPKPPKLSKPGLFTFKSPHYLL